MWHSDCVSCDTGIFWSLWSGPRCGSCVPLLLHRTKQCLFVWAVALGSICTYWVWWRVVNFVNTYLQCNDQHDIVETCFVQSCENILHVRQFVSVCTLMVKRRSIRTDVPETIGFVQPFSTRNAAWIYVMIEGSFLAARCEKFGCTVSSELHKRRIF